MLQYLAYKARCTQQIR